MKAFSRLCLLIFLSIPLAVSAQTNESSATEIIITDTIVADDIEAIGANLTTLAGGTNLASNNLIRGSGMEPGMARYLVRIENAGSGWIEWIDSLGGVSMWEQAGTGYGDGATVRLYRLVDAAGQPLSYNHGQDFNAVDAADHVVFLGETTVPEGGWIAEEYDSPNNRVYLDDTATEFVYGDYAIFTMKKLNISADEINPRLLEWYEENVGYLYPWMGGTATLDPHTGELPAEFTEPGETSLKLTPPDWVSAEERVGFGQYLFHGADDGEGRWYSQLEPGASYRAEVWLRQEDLTDGQVWFYLGGAYDGTIDPEPWTVTDQWQKFSFDFTGPAYPDPANGHGALGLQVASTGTLWVDNFVVYRNDEAHDFRPFTPHEVAFNELMASLPAEGEKPVVRFYPTTYHTHSSMERLLSNYASGHIDFIYNVQAPQAALTIPHVMEWALATGSSPEERIIPYITLSEEYTEVEWLQLVEYLGVPYDPAVDTPESKPWAYLRTQQRGVTTPWTDEFREVILEFGNETWHNGACCGWDGFGAPGWVFFGGREYGLFAHYYFVENVMAQPWWSENNLNEKITFSINAGYDASTEAYGEMAVQQMPDAFVYLGHANYVGPTWETEDEVYGVFDDYGMQETLVGGYVTMLPLIAQVNQTRQDLMAAGLANYEPIAYEGGPSGYSLPGTVSDEQVQVSELYGKSLGMAVSALDAWLYSSLNGYSHQAYLGFEGGEYWSSHTMPRMGGFRRHTGWLALMLRNRYASGDEMLETSVNNAPTLNRDGEAIPLISAYTLRDEDRLSVFVLSRQLDASTPITLQMPIQSCTAVTRYALTSPDGTPANPRSNNIETENVAITSVSVDPAVCDDGVLIINEDTGGTAAGMPPGTVYLYVFE